MGRSTVHSGGGSELEDLGVFVHMDPSCWPPALPSLGGKKILILPVPQDSKHHPIPFCHNETLLPVLSKLGCFLGC